MNTFKVKIYKHGTHHFVVSHIEPKTDQRRRRKFTSLTDAKKYSRQLKEKFRSKGAHSFIDARVSQLMQLHLEKCPHSRVRERKNSFLSFCEEFGAFKIGDLCKSDLEVWFARLKRENDYTNLTLKRFKSQLNHFFNFLVEQDYIVASPLEKIRFKGNEPPKRARVVLSVQEVHQLLDNAKVFCPDYLYPYLFTVAHSGARRNEVLNLKRDDVDLASGFLHFRKTKNGEARSIRITEKLQDLLKNHLESHRSESVFIGSEMKVMGASRLRRLLNSFREAYPIGKDWTLHSLRHSLAYNYLQKGGEMYQLQAILGHKTIGMTIDLYGQIAAQDVKTVSPYDD